MTREHDDIDVAAWRTDYDAIGTALQAAGWRDTPVPEQVVGTRYQWGMALVEFTFMTTDTDGQVVIPLPDHPVVWSAEPFGDERRQLSGVDSRIIPLALLKAGKSSAREWSTEVAPKIAPTPRRSAALNMTTSTTSSVPAKGDPHVTPVRLDRRPWRYTRDR